MRKPIILCLLVFSLSIAYSQKKPLDHSVYDGWQSIGEKLLSSDGQWVVYNINVQEGDNDLIIQSTDGRYRKLLARGYNPSITQDSRYLVFRIKPFFKDTREAKIKKKKQEDFPKDSLAIMELGKDSVWKIARIKLFKIPEKSGDWLAYQLEKPAASISPSANTRDANLRLADSLRHIIDSLVKQAGPAPNKNKKKKKDEDGEGADLDSYLPAPIPPAENGDLVLRNLETGAEKYFPNVEEFLFDKLGTKLLLKKSADAKDSTSRLTILLYNLASGEMDTLSRSGNDFTRFVFSNDGLQLAYLAERDAQAKELQKFYKLWYYEEGMDSARMVADKNSVGMRLGMTVSENGNPEFSKSGRRLFFGTALITAPADTNLVEFEHPKVDIWHYNDDYLQTVQLVRLSGELKKTYLAVLDLPNSTIHQLGTPEIPSVLKTKDGDEEFFVGLSDVGKRIESQWNGYTLDDIYAIRVDNGEKKLVKENLFGEVYPSSTGNYILWYDRIAKNYFAWDGKLTRNITEKIKTGLWDAEEEVPVEPSPYGVMGWVEGDSEVLVYDRFDIWRVDPKGARNPAVFAEATGHLNQVVYRYVQVDPEKTFFKPSDTVLLRSFNEVNKTNQLVLGLMKDASFHPLVLSSGVSNYLANTIIASPETQGLYIYTKENFGASPDLYSAKVQGSIQPGILTDVAETRLSAINLQQANYLWGSVELFKWKAYNGKEATGLVYKPENFDPKKKYPMICYFYETLSDNLNRYYSPAPIRSAINIPFFVSRGYIIFIPDIHYGTGHPGNDSYNYVVSGARAVAKKGYIDSSRMAIQGHSWGGYQVAYIITKTKLFKAAWAGAPVANMTSAYGGIRWESGLNRQFQYEKAQSRIGATLWEKPQLYLENSPLFHLDKVATPVVLMANDADGAVPWYQGIEMFTALRRLGKKVWMFNYNGQGHGLTQRQDMRDYEIRMQQFFDWILKDEPPARWITEGVPATRKGKDWGLEID